MQCLGNACAVLDYVGLIIMATKATSKARIEPLTHPSFAAKKPVGNGGVIKQFMSEVWGVH
jgi:hypothetical protein